MAGGGFYSFGKNDHGQLGLEGGESRLAPVRVCGHGRGVDSIKENSNSSTWSRARCAGWANRERERSERFNLRVPPMYIRRVEIRNAVSVVRVRFADACALSAASIVRCVSKMIK